MPFTTTIPTNTPFNTNPFITNTCNQPFNTIAPFGVGFNGLGFNNLGFNNLGFNGLGFDGLGFNGLIPQQPFAVNSIFQGAQGLPVNTPFNGCDWNASPWTGFNGTGFNWNTVHNINTPFLNTPYFNTPAFSGFNPVQVPFNTGLNAFNQFPVNQIPFNQIPFNQFAVSPFGFTGINQTPFNQIPFAQTNLSQFPVNQFPVNQFSQFPINQFPVNTFGQIPFGQFPVSTIGQFAQGQTFQPQLAFSPIPFQTIAPVTLFGQPTQGFVPAQGVQGVNSQAVQGNPIQNQVQNRGVVGATPIQNGAVAHAA